MHQAAALPSDVWIGAHFSKRENRLLILGESTYGTTPPLEDYIRQWADRKTDTDHTFSRLFNACNKLEACDATEAQRLAFWDSVAFYNFVLDVLTDRETDPTPAQFSAGKPALEAFLKLNSPRGVWILGTGQARYSRPVVEQLGIPYVIQKHPTSIPAPTKSVMKHSWEVLKAIAL